MQPRFRSTVLALMIAAAAATGAIAANQSRDGTAAPASPYAGQHTRPIKALSPQEIDDYLNGRGLGYAKAAELNHYPGPRHVLDLAGELSLSAEQVDRSQAVFEAMRADAIALGTRLVALEQQLDRHFADQSAREATLRDLTAEIGAVEARLRFVHLSAHLKQKALLTAQQVHHYDQLRGYGSNMRHEHAHTH